MERSPKHGFVEVSLEGGGPQKFHRQSRRPDERAQDPGKLAAQQQIAAQPGQQYPAGHPRVAAQVPQQSRQPQIGCDPGECDDPDVRQLDEILGAAGYAEIRRHGRRVPDQERRQRTERAEYRRRDGETHQDRQE